ncbi:hypothetical protein NO1_1662 [Candidatus Termititenax aidoneus]|uniref:Uncharacterized protein n=1 Tax=Termititenax aidoneus TaxID=2218524 RepID=A0A388TD82_TERA1|nr:hypothetical protein NO1_1662 [Candidatus Termititenax aidoneus]
MGIKRLIFFSLLLPVFLSAYTKLPLAVSNEIVAFTLFNYDNLIADSYENNKPYIKQLVYLLSRATKISETKYSAALQSPEFSAEDFPVSYMLKLNRRTREISGYYFVDTDE